MKEIIKFVRDLLRLNIADLGKSKRRKVAMTEDLGLAWRVRFTISMTVRACPCCNADKMFPCGGDHDDHATICVGRLLSEKQLERVLRTGKYED